MSEVTRRHAIKLIAAAGTAAATGCDDLARAQEAKGMSPAALKREDSIVGVTPLAFVWETRDPFLFCVHHDDAYPSGNDQLGPAVSLAGRNIGQDFAGIDGWRMYHGDVVPGFPQHPHRGFETVTVVRHGLLDHSDSLGATARYGNGDVQWLTAGGGILHAEMFPLLEREGPNPFELFQIWLNLPSANKMVAPHFTMLWDEGIPRLDVEDDAGRRTTVTVMAGRYHGAEPPSPPPDSWASQADADVAIWTIKMAPGAHWTLPAARLGTQRSLYAFRGAGLGVDGYNIGPSHRIELRDHRSVALENGGEESELLLLQGRPINEPVAHHGPFVMNSQTEIRQAFADYRRTQFGGWPWDRDDPVHPRGEGRFARRPGGKTERPG